MARILIADQVSARRNILCTFLRAEEHVIIPVSNNEEAFRLLKEVQPDLIIAEGTASGTKLLAQAHEIDANAGIIMILSGPPSVEQLIELMNQGISDVLVSPLDINDVQTKVDRALSRRPGADAAEIRFRDLVGSSPKMQQVFRKIVKAGASESPVLIIGDKGTGKRQVAEQIHAVSVRKDRGFRSVNCLAVSSVELESELFGHEAGAFPGATQRRRGQVELSNGGSLCLQEVGALSPRLQARLLRLLEQQVVERLGGENPLTVDVRLLIASSDPLLYKVQEGSFQSDLYYCLSTCVIELPPLRARIQDVPELVDHFVSHYDVQVAPEAI